MLRRVKEGDSFAFVLENIKDPHTCVVKRHFPRPFRPTQHEKKSSPALMSLRALQPIRTSLDGSTGHSLESQATGRSVQP